MIEHPGPWPGDIDALDVPAPVAAAVARAGRLGVRVQFVRRTRRRRATPPFHVYVAHSGVGRGRRTEPAPDDGIGSRIGTGIAPAIGVGTAWLEGREVADPGDLAGLDLAAVAAGIPPGFGDPAPGPLFLVCTHGRHSACCARTGTPLARGLAARFGDAVWETTHVGGDRFAANLVCLPHGIYYGNLGPAEAAAAADAYLRGEIVLDRLRGRAGMPEAAQAAEHFVRLGSGILEIDSVRVESLTGASPYDAVVSAAKTRYRVRVDRVPGGGPCGPGCEEIRDTYVVGDLTLLNEASLV